MLKVFRDFKSAVLDAADEDEELLEFILALDFLTWDDEWDAVFGRDETRRFCIAGFRYFGDIVKMSKEKCQEAMGLDDTQMHNVERLITAQGLEFEMDTSIWDAYRREAPRGFFATRFEW